MSFPQIFPNYFRTQGMRQCGISISLFSIFLSYLFSGCAVHNIKVDNYLSEPIPNNSIIAIIEFEDQVTRRYLYAKRVK